MLRVYLAKGDAYALLKRAVGEAWGMEGLPPIARAEGGKPFFPGHPGRHFSLSHSGGLALCALSDSPVGADVEAIRPRRANLPAYVLKGADWERYKALGGDWGAFYVLWTELESIVKYTGEGLAAWRQAQRPPWCVITNLSGANWRAAVCGHERAAPLEHLKI